MKSVNSYTHLVFNPVLQVSMGGLGLWIRGKFSSSGRSASTTYVCAPVYSILCISVSMRAQVSVQCLVNFVRGDVFVLLAFFT